MAKLQPPSEFSTRTFKFLKDLKNNNNRTWFQGHKDDYEMFVREPALAFIEAFAPRLAAISPHFVASPKRVGGSLMRIYRDMRFSKNGEPYKTNIGIQFRHERGRDVHAPGFYLHVEPGGCFLGAGIWRPEAPALRAIRMEIADRPKDWRKVSTNKRFSEFFSLSGEQLTRPPKGFSQDSPHLADLRRKDFIAIASVSDAFVRGRELPANFGSSVKRAAPLMGFLCEALDLAF